MSGNPFGTAKVDFDARVLDLMQGRNRGLPAKFVSSAGPETDPLYKTVVAFNPPRGTGVDDLCRDAEKVSGGPTVERLRVAMVFCEGDTALSSASGSAGGIGGASDARFAELVRETTFFMVPDDGHVEYLRNTAM